MNPLGTDAPGPAQAPDLRLCAPAAATWLTALAVPSLTPGTAVAVAVTVLTAAAGAVPWLRRERTEAVAAAAIAVLLCAGAVALAGAGRVLVVRSSPVTALAADARTAAMEVRITGDPRPRSGAPRPGQAELVVDAVTAWVRVDGARVGTRVPVVLLVSGRAWRALVPSQRVRLSGAVLAAERDPLLAALVVVRGPPSDVRPPGTAHGLAAEARARLRAACAGLPQPERGLLPAVVVGDDSRIPESTAEDFRAAGMTHLLTVSGANLAVLTGVVLALGRWLRRPPWVTVLAGAVMIAVFVLVARPEPSVLRAAFMGAIALLALALGRQRAGVAALSAAVIGLLLFDPGLARSYGFALSVLATGAIMVLAPRWRDRWSARMPPWAAEALAVPLAAHLACAPVLVLLSPEVSWVAVPANALTGPVMPLATIGGFAVAGIALAWPDAASVAAWVPAVPVRWTATVAEYAAGVPDRALPWRGDLLGAIALALLILVALRLRGRVRSAALALGAAVVATALAVQCTAPLWPPSGWAVVACDVGQGDAVALAAGEGRAVVVDAGVDPAPVDRCLRDLGVREVALLVLTHGDSDHVGGVEGVLGGREVRAALGPPGFDAPAASAAVRRAGVPWHSAAAGRRWTDGPWSFSVLWPGPGPVHSSNDASVVLHARWSPPPDASAAPMTVLLTGDIEEAPQRALLNDPAVQGVDVLKVPHHGAKTQDPGFLAASRARVTLTSVGADNTYGHPEPGTWRRLEALTTANYRTDRHGDIAVVPGAKGPAVVPRGPGAREP